jgi:soluble lytic murein transglycosylase-like protein
MNKHLVTILMSAAVMLAAPSARAQSIVPVHDERGRTVWVNNDVGQPQAKPQPSAAPAFHVTDLVYWSRTEKRWKPVPRGSVSSMRAARQAAREVTDFVAAAPLTGRNSQMLMNSQPIAPDMTGLMQGRNISSDSVDKAIDASANRHGVDPNLVRAIIQVESNFNPHAVSRKGAMGLMQLMPTTARSMNVNNAFDPNQNVDAGVRHLKTLLQNYNGNLELSLAAYNAGSGAVNRNGGVPPYRETRDYVKKITSLYNGGSGLSHRILVSRDSEGHRVFTTE